MSRHGEERYTACVDIFQDIKHIVSATEFCLFQLGPIDSGTLSPTAGSA
jgi:hypothetical protein